MIRQILPISALLLGSAFLLFAGGMNSLILPVRGSQEGFSAILLGLLGTSWALGYVLGCIFTPVLVSKVGHIRAFSVMAAFAAIAILGSLIVIDAWVWISLRSVSGFCFAGAAMIVESWMNERADPASRGRIFGVYTMVNLVASTGGQMALTLGDTTGFLFFVLPAIFYILALVPTAMTSTSSPQPLVSVRLDIRALWRNSPVAVFGVLMVGVSNSAFGTLAAVYADRIGLLLTSIALFASLPILAGALSQLPVGYLSDKMDRRRVLLGLALLGVVADLGFIFLSPEGQLLNMGLACMFGASIYAMYPVIVAHANDHAAPGTYIQISGGLLLVYGIGAIVGPLIAGFGMASFGVSGLFMTTNAAHFLIILFTLWRIGKRADVASADKGNFVASPMARSSTPQTAVFALDEEDTGKAVEKVDEAGT